MAKWCTIAPILYSDIEKKLALPFDLGNGVRLLSIPAWLKEDTMTKYLDSSKRERLLDDANYAIEVIYDAPSYGTPDPAWKGKSPRSLQDRALEFINLCNIAIWISNPCSFRYELIYDVYEDNKEWNFKSCNEYIGLSAHKKYENYRLNMQDLLLAKELFDRLITIQRPSTVWVAIRSLWRALTEDTWEVRFLLTWIVLEGLFGPEDPREITYRLSQRLSFFLHPEDKKTAKELNNHIRKVYGWRSKIVHGMRLNNLSDDESDDILYKAEQWSRHSLLKILRSSHLSSMFIINENREAYLDNLIYE